MDIDRRSENPLYQFYRDAGPTPALIAPAALFFLFGYAGVLMNLIVIVVTVKTPKLHGTAHFLMALICACEKKKITVSGINFISFYWSARLLFLMVLGLNASMCAMACAAFDRLIAMIVPIWHRNLKKPLYLSCLLLISVCYGVFVDLSVFRYYTVVDPRSPTTGCISELLSGPPGEKFFMESAIQNGIATLFYAILWIVIRCRKSTTSTTNARLLKSLVIILLINVGGYFFTLGTYQILFHLPPGSLNPIFIWHIGFVSGVLLNIGAGCNAIVLYINSTDYRHAFRKDLQIIQQRLGLRTHWSNTVHQIWTTSQLRNQQRIQQAPRQSAVGPVNARQL